MKTARLRDIPQFTRFAAYRVDHSWLDLLRTLECYQNPGAGAQLDLNPDFQRAHVWTDAQKTAYVEYMLRGGLSGRDLYFNCVGWNKRYEGPFVIVDGKQRLNAATEFLQGRVRAFGRFLDEYADRLLHFEPAFTFHINDLGTRAEVLTWYLEMNTGGTVHTQAELDKVRAMLAIESGTGAKP